MAKRTQQRSSETLDPSNNVSALVNAAVRHLSDLKIDESVRVNEALKAERRRVSEIIDLRAKHATQLAVAEAKRLDAIRAVDVSAVTVANERATAQAEVLAKQVASSAETLRALVATTAATQAQQLDQLTSLINSRLSSLEKTQYEKQGSGTGMQTLWGYVFAIGAFIISTGLALYVVLRKQ